MFDLEANVQLFSDSLKNVLPATVNALRGVLRDGLERPWTASGRWLPTQLDMAGRRREVLLGVVKVLCAAFGATTVQGQGCQWKCGGNLSGLGQNAARDLG